MNIAMVGNLMATLFVGVAVFLASQWRPNPNEDGPVLYALMLAFSGGLLTALSSQIRITLAQDKFSDERFCQECGQSRKVKEGLTDGVNGE